MDLYYNFNEVVARVPANIEALVQTLYPEGKKRTHNWCVGDYTGAPGQSFQISLKPATAGCYIDRANPEVSGNPIALVALRKNISYQEAGEWLAKFVGVQPEQRIFKRKNRPKPVIKRETITKLKPRAIAYAESRGITEATLRRLNIASDDNALVMPHYDVDGQVVLLKYWPTDGSKNLWSNENPIHTLFGKNLIDPIKSGGRIIITEGQWDAMTWIQLGYPAVSIPSGVSNDHWIEEDWVFLNQFTEIYLDYDNDAEGRDGEARVRTRLGYERCKLLRYGLKDANEALKLGRPEILVEAFTAARDAPVENIIVANDIRHTVRNHLSRNRTSTGVPFFISSMARKLEFRPHETTLWYGHTGHGKSTAIMNQFAYQASLGIPGLIASFEDNTSITYSVLLKQFSKDQFIGSSEDYDAWYDRLTSMVHLFDSMKRTEPDVIVATMILAHKQLGICHFAVDNVMTLDVDRQDNTQQAAVADKFRVFVSRFPVHLHLAAHPRKPQEAAVVRPPQLAEVRGASEWADMAQNAICVYRDMKKAERLSEMYDEGLSPTEIMNFRMSCRDGKFIVRKQRFNGELPICSYMFDSPTKRFHKDEIDFHPYWDPAAVEEPEEEFQ